MESEHCSCQTSMWHCESLMLQVQCHMSNRGQQTQKVKETSKGKVEFWRGYNAKNKKLNCNFALNKQ